MPNRILKESICVSDTIDQLDWFEEVLFYRLIVNCDDYGRFDGRVPIIKGRLFPLKLSLTTATVQKALNKLATVGLVLLYEVDGRPILQLSTWDKHQQIRAHKSKYPAFDSSCNQLISDASNSPRNPIQSESNPNQNPNTEPAPQVRKAAPAYDELFAEFWSVYPRKIAKPKALKAFQKLRPDRELLGLMLAALERQKRSDRWKEAEGQFIPYPATWLNDRRWEDQTTVLGTTTARGPENSSFDAQELQDRILRDFMRADDPEGTP